MCLFHVNREYLFTVVAAAPGLSPPRSVVSAFVCISVSMNIYAAQPPRQSAQLCFRHSVY